MVPLDKRQGTSAISVKVSALYFARVGLVLIFAHAVFFEESWTELVVTTAPYNQETITRTTNDEDSIFATENTVSGIQRHLLGISNSLTHIQAGYNATAQLSMIGSQLSDGLLGYVTLGVDPSASYTFTSTGYYTGDN